MTQWAGKSNVREKISALHHSLHIEYVRDSGGDISVEYIFMIKTTPDTPALPVLLSQPPIQLLHQNVQQQQRKKKGERSG